ncbi:hypothetical protein [uncultured Ruegeria sp.]|uniref:hypothetical protein n=1 Tax=uncultured Ruegeria sp. TaxID=259304 RepID=UPI00261CFCEA|nr:hypothetical protein [uncultured Ruegeria sp.]
MQSLRFLLTCFACLFSGGTLAQSSDGSVAALSLELNAMEDVDGACRMTFLANNQTGSPIDEAVFETVIFDLDGSVLKLSLFDFRALPSDRPRVRQFDLPGMSCASVGRALINGANSCVINGSQSSVCESALTLDSRIEVELLG